VFACIDPGLHHCGVALFSDQGELLDARLIDERGDPQHPYRGMIFAVADHVSTNARLQSVELVIERPQIYRNSPADPNDLISLAVVIGGLLAVIPRGRPAMTYLPRDWKGQVPKEVTEQRCRIRLSSAELQKFKEKRMSLAHNVWDAVGLGMHHLRVRGIRS